MSLASSTIKNFKEQGVDTSFISQVSMASGVAPIWVEPDGTNRIICVPGANNEMRADQVEEALKSIGEFSILIGQLEIPQEVTAAAFRLRANLESLRCSTLRHLHLYPKN